MSPRNAFVPQSTDALLRLEDVRVYFSVRKGFFRALTVRGVDGVTLELGCGETVALVGESGCGKTTLGRASLRLVKPTAGQVVFDGTEISRVPEDKLKWFRRRAQAIFQDPYASIDPFMNVSQIVEEPLLIHNLGDSRGERRERVRAALRDVKLTPVEEFEAKYPHHLSGGQRQRVGVARALVLQPEYMVADEAVSMIDASSRAEILHLLGELQTRHGITFLYITHDIATARYFAHRIAVMYLGVIVEVGPASQVTENPLHPYTQALIAAIPDPDPANRLQERTTVAGEPPNPTAVPPGCRFHPRCPSFMKGTCDGVRPMFTQAGPDHYVACYLYP